MLFLKSSRLCQCTEFIETTEYFASSSSLLLKPADDLSVTVLTADLLICQCGVAVSLSQLDLVGMNHLSASIIEVFVAVVF